MVNVGKYTSPMDPMGIFGTVNGSDFRSWALMFFFDILQLRLKAIGNLKIMKIIG